MDLDFGHGQAWMGRLINQRGQHWGALYMFISFVFSGFLHANDTWGVEWTGNNGAVFCLFFPLTLDVAVDSGFGSGFGLYYKHQ